MADKERKDEQGYGKYVLIEKIKEKFRDSFSGNREDEKTIVSTSLLLEGIHFSMVYFPLKHLGYKAVISSVAGIYQKNGVPESVSLNIGIGSRYNIEDIENIIEGITIACDNYDISIADLNIDSSLTGLTLATTATGSINRLYKPGIKLTETDLVCVTGDLGAAFMGLQLLERERKIFEETGGAQPQLKGFEYVIGKQLKPEIDTGIITRLSETGLIPGSVKVLKDGIASDLIGLAKEHNLGCRLYSDKIPYSQETATAGREFNIEPVIAALSGGDDFEFMFTFPVSDFDKLTSFEGLSIVGHLTPEPEKYTLALQDNSLAELKAQGWEGQDSEE